MSEREEAALLPCPGCGGGVMSMQIEAVKTLVERWAAKGLDTEATIAADRAAVANHIADMAALWSQCKIGDEAWCVWQDTYGDEIPGSLSDAIHALAAKLARGEGVEA